jgi:hydroxyacylglutathione hydrolase
MLIDPARDICRYVQIAHEAGLKIKAVAETHIHADFLSGAAEFANAISATCYLSACGGSDWQYTWPANSDANVCFLNDGDTFNIGSVSMTVMHTPGHTPEHICFVVHDRNTTDPVGIATGDFVFVGDLGRPDLLETAAGIEGAMERSAEELHHSCERFLEMDDYLQVWPAHGAGSACGKALGAIPQSTIGYEKRTSPPLQLVGDATSFIEFMLDGQPEPPLYFARMKRMNRDGIPILSGLPTPRQIDDPTELASFASTKTVIDTRPWRAVRSGHLPNSIWSPADENFHRFAGSFVDVSEEIVFIVSEDQLDRAIRNAIRIGLDNIVAWSTPSTIAEVANLETMAEITVDELVCRSKPHVLDVRRSSEFSRGAIDDAYNCAHTRLLDRLTELDTSKQWVVNCHGGTRSAASCMALKREGFEVTNLAGGYSGWKAFKEACLPTR